MKKNDERFITPDGRDSRIYFQTWLIVIIISLFLLFVGIDDAEEREFGAFMLFFVGFVYAVHTVAMKLSKVK